MSRAVRQAMAAVDQVHSEMQALLTASEPARVAHLYLTLHVRSQTGQHSLRWRDYASNGRHVHLSWDEARARMDQQPYAQQAQLVAWDHQARTLNADEIRVRLALKRARAATGRGGR